MKIENLDTKNNLIKRLRRIEGQLRGIQTMLEEERDCREIMQQLSAASSAIKSTSRTFFQNYGTMCLADMDGVIISDKNPDQKLRQEKMLQEMMALLDKTP
ncbi:MAG: metal-sensing transcriptional repressor [Anaerolineales bacterium]|nr:metal-sensing transcriptional repressor [Anaerolineales bacterium]